MEIAADPVSPCIDVCELNDEATCRGCFRTTEEIAAWPSMSNEQKWQVLDAVRTRRLAVTGEI